MSGSELVALADRLLDKSNEVRASGMKYGLRSFHEVADLLIDIRRDMLAARSPADGWSDDQVLRLLDWQPITHLNRGDRLWQILCNAGMSHGPELVEAMRAALIAAAPTASPAAGIGEKL